MRRRFFAFLMIIAALATGSHAAMASTAAKKKASDPIEIKASWIGVQDCDHPIYLKSLFLCFKDIKSATAIISAKGGCQVQINQKTVGDRYMTPGENQGQQYQKYDITRLIRNGTNSVHALVTPYSSTGNAPKDRMLLMQVNITYKNGKSEVFCTDRDWLVSETGPIILADNVRGESINHNIECQWRPVNYITVCDPFSMDHSNLGTVRHGAPICGVDYIETPLKEKVIDFGKVICGWDKAVLRGLKGTEIRIRHACSLDSRGNFPLGEDQMSAFTSSQDVDTFESTHTIYKFRYICVEGVDGPLFLNDFMAIPAIGENEDDKTSFLFSDTGLSYSSSDNVISSISSSPVSIWEDYQANGNKNLLRNRYTKVKYKIQAPNLSELSTQKDAVMTAVRYAANAKCMMNIAKLLDMEYDAKTWERYFTSIREFCLKEYVTPSGRMVSFDPLVYAMALKWEIIPADMEQSVLKNMLYITPSDYRLPDEDADVICSVLAENGYDELAYTLARSNNTSIDNWLKTYVLGIRATSPGYKTFEIRPHLENRAKHSASGGIATPQGRIQISWEAEYGTITKISITVPAGTQAHLLYNGIDTKLAPGQHNY